MQTPQHHKLIEAVEQAIARSDNNRLFAHVLCQHVKGQGKEVERHAAEFADLHKRLHFKIRTLRQALHRATFADGGVVPEPKIAAARKL